MKVFYIDKFNYKHIDKLFKYFYKKYREDAIIFTSHPPVFTVGADEKYNFNLNFIKSDRGGSITYFDEGVLMVYFVFKVTYPAKFYKNVITGFNNFFQKISTNIFYDKKNPGFYIQNRKIASLGFRYSKFTKHGIAININPNLDEFNKINPCNLKGIKATSFAREGFLSDKRIIEDLIIKELKNVF